MVDFFFFTIFGILGKVAIFVGTGHLQDFFFGLSKFSFFFFFFFFFFCWGDRGGGGWGGRCGIVRIEVRTVCLHDSCF